MRFSLVVGFCTVAALFALTTCSRQKENVVVRVYDHALTTADLQDMIPVFDENADSIILRQQYIDTWIADKALLHEAENYLSEKEKKFDKELEVYKQALTIHAYEEKRVEELLNKQVTDQEILQYYEKYKSGFKLKEPIIKINYLKFPLGSQQIETAKKLLFKSERTRQEWDKLRTVIAQHTTNAYLSEDWLLYEDILKEIPMEKEPRSFVKNQTLEISDSSSVYLIRILDFKMNEGYSPLSIEKESIVRRILQQRRVKILLSLRENAVVKARETGEILY